MKILVIILDYNTHVLMNYYITQIVYPRIIRIVTDTLKMLSQNIWKRKNNSNHINKKIIKKDNTI
jgi:hypothetical protein